MNILLQTAGFFVMIVIFIFYFTYRKAAVKSNRLFLYQGIAIFVSIFLDIFSIVLINTPSLNKTYFTELICRLYLITVVLVILIGFVYVLNDITNLGKRKYKITVILSSVAYIISSALIMALPIEIVYDPNGLNDYTQGLPIVLTYVTTFIYMGLTVAITLIFKDRIYKKRVVAVFIFITLWVVGSLVQFIFNYVLTNLGIVILSVSFAETLGSMTIYIMLENPSLNIDRATGALNQRAFLEYVDYCYDKNINSEIVLINYDNEMSKSLMGYDKLSKIIAEALNAFKVEKIFKGINDNFIVIRNKNETRPLFETAILCKDYLYKKNNIRTEIPIRIIYVKNLKLFNDSNDLFETLKYINLNASEFDSDFIEVDQTIIDKIHNRFEIDKKCDVAFLNKRVVVYYQPIYSNVDLKFTSAEALVRLKDEDGKLIYPDSFIEKMEQDGRIVELGKIVFEHVCKFISENDMETLGLHYIEVNLSTIQCMQDNLAETFINIMEKYRINPKYINLEITETGHISKLTLLKNMEILKKYGVSFSLDDFGTGNSNLNYIVEMPVDIVKFDKEMVTSYFDNKIASYVMNSTINMIKGLGHKIVFEGVENANQIPVVRKLNIEYIQGYYYSKPIDEDSFVKFILENNKKFYASV